MPSRLLPAAALLLAHAVLAAPSRFSSKADPVTGSRTFELWDGTTATVGPDGLAWRRAPAESSRGSAAQRRSAAQRPGDTNRGSVAPRPGDTNRGSAAHHVPYTGRSFWTFARPQADDFTLLRALSLPRRDIAVDRVVPGTRPEFWASSMAIEPRALDGSAALPLALARAAAGSGLPSNYGLRTSFQAHLNANGVNATGASTCRSGT